MNQIKIAFSSSFKRALKSLIKKDPYAELIFQDKLTLFLINPYHPQLETHKLKGKLKSYFAFSIQYDLRVIFYFASETEIVFVNIGTHDEVY
jgi:addiction module RelE/StbE family toxin